MTDTIGCPIGCGFEGPPTSVVAHYSGSQTDHPGGYQRAKELVEEELGHPIEGSSSSDTEEPSEPSSGDPAETGSSNPTMGSADPDPDDGGVDECPTCGEDLTPVDDLDRDRWILEHRDTELVCLSCGGEFKHE